MLTRKDLVQAHRLMTMRAGQALLLGEPDNADRPLRRIGIGIFSGLMVGVLLIAGWGIAGLITKDGSIRNMDEATVLIAKGTGTKYVMCQTQKDRLCTAANYASARLAVQGGEVKVRTVATKSLSKFQRGPLIGIPGAPDALPSSLVGAPWSVCVSTVSHNGMRIPASTLAVGRELGGTPLEAGTGVIVAANGRYWLVADGTRMELHKAFLRPLIRDYQLARDYQPLEVPPVWLNGLVPGAQFKAPSIPGYGTRGSAPAGGKAKIGQVYTVEDSGVSAQQWFVLLREGLAPLTRTEAWLLENTPGAPAIVPISRTVANRAKAARLAATGLPADPPRVVAYDGSQPLCASYADPGEPEAGLALGASLPAIADPAAVGTREGALDQVIMRPGTGVLAAVTQNETTTAHVLITEDGRKFAIPTAQDLTKLGYTQAQARPVLSHLMQLMPQGPALDGSAAVRQIP
ncbi:type VII secretion protein EccB [Actinocorallia populi]|uniref:type VII secretion protein EccB n=1 Tax=Actinocorallia populi TaxID=2079200 RepID=UPI000D08CBE9|nr:type VII secretion protein EccB [Actinocorallia populi]